jgi:putative ABC transport system substrate-binding protein
MRRREFTAGMLLAAVPWSARAQQQATKHRIAIFHPAIPTTLLTETGGGTAWRAFFSELRRLGYVEAENLVIERYSAEGHHERYANLAREIVTSSPDLIVTGTNPVVIAFKAATSTIPIVAFMLDPLKAGLVTNLAKPGGNLTGITLDRHPVFSIKADLSEDRELEHVVRNRESQESQENRESRVRFSMLISAEPLRQS